MASFLDAFRAGQSVADTGISAYDRAQSWKERLAEKDTAHTEKEQARQTEARRYEDESFRQAELDRIAKEKEISGEKHARKQDELIDAEVKSINSGHGRYGAGGMKNARDYSAVDRGNLIRSMSQMKMLGQLTADQETQLNDLIDIQATGGGFVPGAKGAKTTATKPGSDGLHPLNWLMRHVGYEPEGGAKQAPLVNQDDWRTFDK